MIKKTLSTVDIETQSTFNALENNPTFFNCNNNNSNNNNLPPPPLPETLFQPPQAPAFTSPPTAPISFQLAFRLSPSPLINFPPTPTTAKNNLNFNFSKTTRTTILFGELTAEKTLEDYKRQETLQRQLDDVLT